MSKKVEKKSKFPDVDEILRDSFLDRAYKTGDKELFMKFSSPNWREHLVKDRDEEEEYKLYRRLDAWEKGETLLPWQESTPKNRGIQTTVEGVLPREKPSIERKEKSKRPSSPSCPNCNSSMVKRQGRYGDFWGCSDYPSCRGTKNI